MSRASSSPRASAPCHAVVHPGEESARHAPVRHSRAARDPAPKAHARRMLSENQNAVAAVRRCTAGSGIVLGVPHDIVNPAVTRAVKNFNSQQRRTQVNIRLAPSATLKGLLKNGEVQIILTTEFTCEAGGIALGERDVIWTGAPDSQASKRRPIPLAYVRGCLLAKEAQATLAGAGLDWIPAIDSDSVLAIEAAVAADQGIYAAIRGGHTVHLRPLPVESGLPPLRSISVFCYRGNGTGFESELSELVGMLHQALAVPPCGRTLRRSATPALTSSGKMVFHDVVVRRLTLNTGRRARLNDLSSPGRLPRRARLLAVSAWQDDRLHLLDSTTDG